MADTRTVQIKPAKGRPMLTWVGKRPLRNVTAYPAQLVETFSPKSEINNSQPSIWKGWPSDLSARSACSSTAITKTCWLICSPTASAARSN